MTEPQSEQEHGRVETTEQESLYGLTLYLVENVRQALAEKRPEDIAGFLEPLHAADAADLLEALTPDEARKLIVEPAGAAGLAALLEGRIPLRPDARVVVVLSGGNMDTDALTRTERPDV